MHYLDNSALVKLVRVEAETDALLAWASGHDGALATSVLARTELLRAVRRADPTLLDAANVLLDALYALALPTAVFDEVARVEPIELRSLDAVHLAAALRLGRELESFVCYDERLSTAVRAAGVRVVAPA